MQIEFDPDKERQNVRKYGLSLSLGASVLADPNVLEVLDLRFDYGEERIIAYGMTSGAVCVCAFTMRGNTARIISVRKAEEREIRRYFEEPR